MRRASGWVLVVALAAALPAALSAQPLLSPDAEPPDLFPGDAEAMPALESAEALPQPSIREPFSIGEALYDPARVPAAVVSLLDLMGVPTIGDEAPDSYALALHRSEVEQLIAMGVADARVAAETENPPFTFADLHSYVSPLLPGIDAERLAEAYSEAYAARPADLVPSVLMGQPITPETPLTRVQIWLLLVDGFVKPGGGAGARRAALDRHADPARADLAVWRSGNPSSFLLRTAGGSTGWGTANAQVPQLQSPSSDWNYEGLEWFVSHLLTVASRIPFAMNPVGAVAHEGHGGPGQRVTLEAKLGSPPMLLAGPMARPLLVRRSAQLAGCGLDWEISPADLSTLSAHGTVQAALGTVARTDASGAVRFGYVPKKEAANGQGTLMTEVARVGATIVVAELLRCAYDLPANLTWARRIIEGGARTVTTPLRIDWHSEGLELRLTNSYDVALDFGPLGKTHRWGYEGIRGTLAKRADGSYRGLVRARTKSEHVGGGLGKVCPQAKSDGTQWLVATATPVDQLNRSQSLSQFRTTTGQPDGGYLKLTFEPATGPNFSAKDDCQDADELLFRTCESCLRMLPFNDARWTTPEHAFVIAIPQQGKLVYADNSLADVTPPAGLGPFRAIIKGTFTKLKVDVERTDKP